MTSINTNIAAQTALRTLQSTNMQLDQTQSRISTGLKIAEAKDNAAYWSISTTLKSDSRSLATVQDALSLGAATVDTAYQGTNQARAVLEEIQNKIILASGNSADKDALQAEITQLQQNLSAIANSAGFSGENWLSVDSTAAGYSGTKSVVSSFNRQASGSVSLDTIQINAANFVLINADTATSGILDGGKEGNSAINGLTGFTGAAVNATKATVTPAGTFSTPGGSGNFTGIVTVNGTQFNFTVATTASTTVANLQTAILAGTNSDGVLLSTLVDVDATTLEISTKTAGAATLSVNVTVSNTGFTVADTPGEPGVAAGRSVTSGVFGDDAITLDSDDSISFSVTVDGRAQNIVITKADVDEALTSSDGIIADAEEYSQVITAAMTRLGVTGVTASFAGSGATGTVVLTSAGAAMSATNAEAKTGNSILNLDVSTADAATLASFREMVVTALGRLTDNAATLGAVAKRIELQDTFVSKLVDTIDKGVSGLVDADMNEESTRLQALQVKQQLGVQALSIANQSAQNVLALFR